MRNSRARARKLAAASMLGGLLLVPAMVANGPGLGFLPAAAAGLASSPLPVPGDVLRMLTGLDDPSAGDLGASGRLPEADTLSPDLLAALTKPNQSTGAGPLATVPPGPLGIPGILLEAYTKAASRTAATNPRCGLSWSVLAAIGRIESNHARGGRVDLQGTTVSPILGPQLSGGPGIAAISDSDDGRYDGDTTWDRAVGPMQFIPTTWARYAIDGNADGIADPHNVFDSTLAAAGYLCVGGSDLRDPAALAAAIFRYNHSESYVRTVLTWASAYATGVTSLPSTPGEALPVAPPPIVVPPTTIPPSTGTPPPSTSTSTAAPTTTSTTTSALPPTSDPTTTTPPETTSSTVPPTSDTCSTTTTTTTTTTETTTATTTPPPGCPADAPASQTEASDPSPAGTTTSLPAT